MQSYGPLRNDREYVKSVLSKFVDNLGPTLAASFDWNVSKYGWENFAGIVNQLRVEGLLEAKGDGFVVHWYLTKKGQEALNNGTV